MLIRRKKNSAFTIVELLVAAAITVLIVVLLGSMFGSLSRTATQSNQSIDAFREARAALQMMTRDLKNLVRVQWEPDPFASPAPTASPKPTTLSAAFLALEPPIPAPSPLYSDPAPGNQQVFALVTKKNLGKGDVCAIGYYCRWSETGYNYSLYRFFHDSTATYKTLADAAAGNPAYAAESILYTPDLPNTKPKDLKDEVVATNVWNLKFVAYDATGAIIPLTAPYICDASATTPVQVPAVIEISFRAMSSEAARTVIAAQAPASVWMNDQNPTYVRLIKPHTYEFKTRIKL